MHLINLINVAFDNEVFSPAIAYHRSGRKFSFFKFKGQNFCVYMCVRTACAEFQIPSGTYNDNENSALRNSS